MTIKEKIKITQLGTELSSEEQRIASAAEKVEYKYLKITGLKSSAPALLVFEIASSTMVDGRQRVQDIQTIMEYIEAKSKREGAIETLQILI